MALFVICAIITGAGQEVAITNNNTIHDIVTNDTWTETDVNVILSGGTQTSWISFLFYGFAILNLILLSKDYTYMMKQQENKR